MKSGWDREDRDWRKTVIEKSNHQCYFRHSPKESQSYQWKWLTGSSPPQVTAGLESVLGSLRELSLVWLHLAEIRVGPASAPQYPLSGVVPCRINGRGRSCARITWRTFSRFVKPC